MKNKKSSLILLILTAALLSVIVGTVTVSAQAPCGSRGAPACPTATVTAAPSNTPAPRVAPATATSTKAPATTTKVPATATAVPSVTRTATRPAALAPVTPVRQRVTGRLAPGSIPGPAGTFASAFTIQNQSASVANCSYQFFNSGGTSVYTSAAFTISVGGQNFTYVPGLGGLGAGQYSGVVSCDQQVAAIVNMTTASSGSASRAVDGATVGTTWYAPSAFDNYFFYFTNFVVQNASASPVDIYVNVVNTAGTTVLQQSALAVPANASASFEQTGQGAMADNVQYSAKITATGNVAVEANVFGNGGATTNQLYSYNPFAGGATTVYAPVILNNYFGYLTALTVQNIGGSSTNVTVTYATGLTNTATIAGNANALFYTPSSGLPGGATTSAKIQSSGQPIVAYVNTLGGYNRAASYTAFSAGTTTARAPIITRRYFGYNTAVTCQNLGGAATTVTIQYAAPFNGGGSTVSGSIAPNASAFFYQPGDAAISDNYNGSATMTASQPIVCIVNQNQDEAPNATITKDQLFTYEAVNQ